MKMSYFVMQESARGWWVWKKLLGDRESCMGWNTNVGIYRPQEREGGGAVIQKVSAILRSGCVEEVR